MSEQQASGRFDVDVQPQSPPDAAVGRFSLQKQFHGDLEGSSVGEMLGIRTDVDGSAGYVAMERVTGILQGRTGSFALQHSGTMDRNRPTMSVTVVPDSGTGELKGITGEMSIEINSGEHHYTFRYRLPPANG